MLWVSNNSQRACLHVCVRFHFCHDPAGCPALDSVVVLEEGSGLSGAQSTATWVDSDEFGPVSSHPIYMSADKSTKTPPCGTLSRVGARCNA